MGVSQNIERMRRFYASGPADRDEEREQFFADDAVWHVRGDNPSTGDYRGVEAISTQISERMQPLGLMEVEPRHVIANLDHVVAVAHIKGERRGQRIDMHGAHIFHFDDAGHIVEAWGFTDDQAAVDEFFRA